MQDQPASNNLEERLASTIRKGGAVIVVGWFQNNHNEETSQLATSKRVKFSQQAPSFIPPEDMVIFTQAGADEIRKMRGRTTNFHDRPLTLDGVRKYLEAISKLLEGGGSPSGPPATSTEQQAPTPPTTAASDPAAPTRAEVSLVQASAAPRQESIPEPAPLSAEQKARQLIARKPDILQELDELEKEMERKKAALTQELERIDKAGRILDELERL